MTVTIVQSVTTVATRAVDVPVDPLTAGNMLVIAAFGAMSPISAVAVGGVPATAAVTSHDTVTSGVVVLHASLWVGATTAGATVVTVTPETHGPSIEVVVLELAGAVIAPRPVVESTAGGGGSPISFDPPDVTDPALLLAVMVLTDSTDWSTPWSVIDNSPIPGTADGYGLVLSETAPAGVTPPETWVFTPVGGSSWLISILAVQTVGHQIQPSIGYAEAGAVVSQRAGHVEAPVGVTPYDPEPDPLPPSPQPVVLPGPPWVPAPGRQYRPRVSP